MNDPILPSAQGNVGSAAHLLANTGMPAFTSPAVNQPPPFTREQAAPVSNVPVPTPMQWPSVTPPPQTGFVHQAPAWTRPAESSAATGIANVAIPIDERGQIQSMLGGYFEPYVNDDNRMAFADLIGQRTDALVAMQHTAERIAANVEKANQFDWLAVATTGAVNSLPFAGATVAIDTAAALTAPAQGSPAGTGLMAGVESAVADNAGTSLLTTGTHNARWLKPGAASLEDVMREALEDKAPAFWKHALQTGAAYQTYTLRNAVRTAAVPAVYAAAGKAAKSTADTTIAAAGGPLAGAGAYMAMRRFDQMNAQEGPGLFFGQRNWESLYRQLDSATWGTQLRNGGVRALRFPLDVATHSVGAVKSLFKPAQMVQTGVLGAGFAGVAAAKSAATHAMENAGYGPVATEFVGQAVNTVASAPVFALWTTAAVGTGPAAQAAAEGIQGIGRRDTALELGDPGAGIEMNEPTRHLIDPPARDV